jgi:hypothetical protein
LFDTLRRKPAATFAIKPILSLAARTVLGRAGWICLLRALGKEQARVSPVDLTAAPVLGAKL